MGGGVGELCGHFVIASHLVQFRHEQQELGEPGMGGEREREK